VPRALNPRPPRTTPRERVADLVLVGLAGAGLVVAVAAYATYRIWTQGYADEARPADAIVVLGAAQYDGTPSPVFRARIDHAVQLWKDGKARWFVVTGGAAEGDRTTEAAAAATYAMEQGVPGDAIIGEDSGRSTLGSLLRLRGIFTDQGIESAVFVSDRGHMLRVLRMAGDLGIEAYGSPAEDSPSDATLERRARATLHELGALGYYLLLDPRGPAQ
jgi:vancomycin permeability regulator SanA